MSSPTSSPAAMIRRTWAPILVWFCTCHRKMSPTLMCTRSKPAASNWPWVLLPLPWTPMMTYLRMPPPWHTALVAAPRGHDCPGLPSQPEPPLAASADLRFEGGAEQRPVLLKQPWVDEAGHVIAAPPREHDAVEAAPQPVIGEIELAQPRPGKMARQDHDSLPGPRLDSAHVARQPGVVAVAVCVHPQMAGLACLCGCDRGRHAHAR